LHPLQQAYLWSGLELYEWQRDVIAEAAMPRSRIAVSTCNESGKTSTVLPIFGLSAMVAFPGCHVFSTSASEQQVKHQLFIAQLEPIVSRLPGWNISTASMYVEAPNGSSWLGYKCKDAGNVEGFHGTWTRDAKGNPKYCPVIYMLDEAKSIGDDIFEAVLRIDPDFMIAISSPGAERGWFYDGVNPQLLERQMDKRESKRDTDAMTKAQIAEELEELKMRRSELQVVMEIEKNA